VDPRLSFWLYPTHVDFARPGFGARPAWEDVMACHHSRRHDPELMWQQGRVAGWPSPEPALRRLIGWFRAIAAGPAARPTQ